MHLITTIVSYMIPYYLNDPSKNRELVNNPVIDKKANDWRTSSVRIDPSVDLGNDSLVYPKVVVCVLSKSQSP